MAKILQIGMIPHNMTLFKSICVQYQFHRQTLPIGMIPHNMTLFKFICVQYQFHRQTLPIMKIDRGQIQFRDYVSTGTEP